MPEAVTTLPRDAPGETLASRREFLVGGALALTALAASTVAFRSGATVARPQVAKLIPGQIGEWRLAPFADVLIPQAEKAEDRNYDEVVTRYYENPSSAGIMLLVAYGSAQVGDTELHRPEACYPVAGFRLRRWPTIRLDAGGSAIPARSLTAVATGRVEQLLYWTRVGREFPTSSVAQRWSAMRQTLDGSVPDGVLVRISTINADRNTAVGIMERFAGELLAAGGPALRTVLTGRA